MISNLGSLFLLLVVFAFLGGCASSNQGSTSVAPATAAAEASAAEDSDAPKTRKICKREKPTGSHKTIVTCRTVEQIDEDRENARRIRDRTGSLGGSPGSRQ